MAIGSCDCCEKSNVPVSSGVYCGMDVTACYLCQGDVIDPYCEIEDATPTQDSSDYACSHWLSHETDAEHAERVANAEQQAIKLASEAHRAWRMICDREPDEPTRNEMARLFDITCDELMRDGEISEAIYQAWDAITPRAALRAARAA